VIWQVLWLLQACHPHAQSDRAAQKKPPTPVMLCCNGSVAESLQPGVTGMYATLLPSLKKQPRSTPPKRVALLQWISCRKPTLWPFVEYQACWLLQACHQPVQSDEAAQKQPLAPVMLCCNGPAATSPAECLYSGLLWYGRDSEPAAHMLSLIKLP